MMDDLIHGGSLDAMKRAFPNVAQAWIDLSTGINPWSYPDIEISPSWRAHLPTKTQYETCQNAMASAIGAPANALLLAPGSELLIRLLPDIIRPKRVAILTPTYADHKQVWTRAGAEVICTPDPLDYATSADAIVITNPNNPNGRLFDPAELESARSSLSERDGWLIIDEAYADLSPEHSLARSGGEDGLIILRSFGKFFGLAGLRLGGLLAPSSVRAAMSERLGVWPISGATLEIGARAYADTDWQTKTRLRLQEAAARLDQILQPYAKRAVAGTALFRWLQVDDAYRTFEGLAQRGIYVRRFRDSHHDLRIGLPATQAAETRLRDALSLLG